MAGSDKQRRPRGYNEILDAEDDLAALRRRQFLERQQRHQLTQARIDALRTALHIPRNAGGSFYGDLGIGLGGGFNLHVDREGVQPSVGGGAFLTGKLGYAPTAKQMRAVRGVPGENKGFIADGPFELSIDGSTTRLGIGPFAFEGEAGKAGSKLGANVPLARGRGTLGLVPDGGFEIGAGVGGGILRHLPGRKWNPPSSRRNSRR